MSTVIDGFLALQEKLGQKQNSIPFFLITLFRALANIKLLCQVVYQETSINQSFNLLTVAVFSPNMLQRKVTCQNNHMIEAVHLGE